TVGAIRRGDRWRGKAVVTATGMQAWAARAWSLRGTYSVPFRRTKQMCPACGLTSTRRPLIYWDTFTRTVREANVSLRLCARQIHPCADPTAAALRNTLIT